MALKTLLIDNYDSYTYNLFQLIAEVNGGIARLEALSVPIRGCVRESYCTLDNSLTALHLYAVIPDVIYNNQLTWPDLSSLLSSGKYHNIVISPGPGTPDCPADVGKNMHCAAGAALLSPSQSHPCFSNTAYGTQTSEHVQGSARLC